MIARVRRWQGAFAGTLLLVTLGLLFGQPHLIATALVPLAYVVAGAAAAAPAEGVTIERRFEPSAPAPGAPVTVTLTVRNTSGTALADLRVIDGVPDELAVVDGSPRAALAFRPGSTRTRTYTVVGKRGDYTFDDPVVRSRSITGTVQRTTVVPADGDRTLSCAQAVDDLPVRRAAHYRVGTQPTDHGASGIEFHSTREYRPGDPLSRLDWRRYAKSGELTTVQFREERANRAVIVVDARPETRVIPRPGYPNGAELSAYAGKQLYRALIDANVATGVTALGLDSSDEDDDSGADENGGDFDTLPWVSAESDVGTTANAKALFADVQQAADRDGDEDVPTALSVPSPATGDGGTTPLTEELLARLPPDAQIVLVSPMLDAWPVSLARSLAVHGYDLLVLSPAVGTDESPGGAIASTHRELRLHDAERTGATTIDWKLDTPLGIALNRSLQTLLSTQ